MNKLVTRDQQLAALAAAEKRRDNAPPGVYQAQRPGSQLTPAAVVAMLQQTPAVGTLTPDAKVPSVPLPTPMSLESSMLPPTVPPSLSPSLAPSTRSSEADFTHNHAAAQARARAATMPVNDDNYNEAEDEDFIPPLPNNPEMFEELPAPPVPSASSARNALVATYMAEMSSRSSAVSAADADTMRLRDAEEENDVQSLMSTVVEDD